MIRFGRGGREKQNKKKTNNCMLCYAILTQFDLEWKRRGGELVQHSCFIQTEKKLSGSYLVVSTHTLGPVHLRGGGGGGGRGVGGGGGGTSSMRHVRLLVWLSVHGFASWSAPEAILFSRSFHLLLDPVYREPPTSHTKRSVSAGTWYRRLYFSPVLGKHLPVKSGTCRSSGGSGVFHVLEEQGQGLTDQHP